VVDPAHRRSERDGVAFGAFAGIELVGAVALEFSAKPKTRHKALVIGMYVLPDWRGNGAGRALLRAAIDRCKSRGDILVMQLTVTDGNEPAVALYRSAGFEPSVRSPWPSAGPPDSGPRCTCGSTFHRCECRKHPPPRGHREHRSVHAGLQDPRGNGAIRRCSPPSSCRMACTTTRRSRCSAAPGSCRILETSATPGGRSGRLRSPGQHGDVGIAHCTSPTRSRRRSCSRSGPGPLVPASLRASPATAARMVLDGVLQASFSGGLCAEARIWWHSMPDAVSTSSR